MMQEVSFSAGPLAPDRLQRAEQALGVQLPDDYRRFMLQYNGGCPEPSGFDIRWEGTQTPAPDWRTSSLSELYSVTEGEDDSLEYMNRVTFAGRIPKDTLAIGSDAGGNVLLLALGGPFAGKVLFWCKDYEVEEGDVPGYDNVGVIADSFGDLVQNRLRSRG